MADDPKNPADPAKGDPDDTKPDPGDLGDGGKKALDAERKRARDEKKRADDLAARLKEIEDKDKSESDRLTEKVAQLEKDLATATAKAERAEVALEVGLDMTRAKRLSGTTREELMADAEELKGWTAGSKDDKPVPGKPAVDLKGGGDPTEDPDVDVRKVVESIPRGI